MVWVHTKTPKTASSTTGALVGVGSQQPSMGGFVKRKNPSLSSWKSSWNSTPVLQKFWGGNYFINTGRQFTLELLWNWILFSCGNGWSSSFGACLGCIILWTSQISGRPNQPRVHSLINCELYLSHYIFSPLSNFSKSIEFSVKVMPCWAWVSALVWCFIPSWLLSAKSWNFIKQRVCMKKYWDSGLNAPGSRTFIATVNSSTSDWS